METYVTPSSASFNIKFICVSIVNFFVLIGSILLRKWITVYLPIHLLINIWAVSSLELLGIHFYESCGHVLSLAIFFSRGPYGKYFRLYRPGSFQSLWSKNSR